MLRADVANYVVFTWNYSKPWTPEAPHDFDFAAHKYFGMIIFAVCFIVGLMMVLYSVHKLKNRRKIDEAVRGLL